MAQSTIKDSTIKHVDLSGTISANAQYTDIQIGFDRGRVVAAIPVYSNDVFYDPVVVSIRSNANSITIVTGDGSPVASARTYTIRVFYV